MTTVALQRAPRPALGALRRNIRAWYPTIVVAANAVAFLLVRPDVNDLWAARARATAVRNGVGLTYWFSWFSGGSTPGNYSVLTPYLSAFTTAEVLCAISAVAIPALVLVALKDMPHPVLGSTVAAFAAVCNLWSGRVPFLFGGALAVAAIWAFRRRQVAATVVLALLSILASPVTGAFLALGLAGVFLSYRQYRRAALIVIVAIGIGMGTVGVVFGTPGPEPFSDPLKVEMVSGLLLLLLARPPIWLRTSIWVTVLATFVLAAFPNGMGSNLSRIVWYCLPVAVLGLSRFRVWILSLIVVPLLVAGANGTVTDLLNASNPVSTVGYYRPLAARLDQIQGLSDYRVEVVNHGAHAGYDALLNHAMLARGWETQEDIALNAPLASASLDAVSYRIWLDNNAVGYVALPTMAVNTDPEYRLVQGATLPYLKLLWQTRDWTLFQVTNPTPIAMPPARVTKASQSALTIEIPCACTISLRVRWSQYLQAALKDTKTSAIVSNDGSGWTQLLVPRAGVYVLRGKLI
ncbi:MAG: hypothetical protein EPN43_07585 [Jatrophihabitans sp.]|nr:MAG: hypothetical protein EPN43_07585 [Jatrophihabitans sp.]